MNDTLTTQICVALVLGIALVIACIEYWLNKIGMSSFMFPIRVGD